MDILVILVLSTICIIAMIAHSYLRHGLWLTFEFFLFAFIVAIIKELPTGMNGVLLQDTYNPYRFMSGHIILNTLVVIIGWIFTFYLAWGISEIILRRAKPLNNYIFPTLLMCYAVIASISYAVETTALGVGWWRWTFKDMGFVGSAVKVPFISFIAWPNFAVQYLLLPFFLIKLSKYKTKEWKNIFIIIPFIHMVTTRSHYTHLRLFDEYAVLAFIVILAFLKPLQFQINNMQLYRKRQLVIGRAGIIDILPFMISGILISTLAIFDIMKIGDIKTLTSLLPLSFFALLAIEEIPYVLLVVIDIALLLFLRNNAALLSTIPLILMAIMKIFTRYRYK